jgi:hypothetical protein
VALFAAHLHGQTSISNHAALSFYAGATPNAVNNFAQAVGEDTPWYLTNGYLAVALLLLILAQVFSYGVRLQKDVEGLV